MDILIAPAASGSLDVWRSIPLPVGDRYYRPVGPPLRGKPRLLFVGRSTPHRERVLMDVKHHHDLLHLAFGKGPSSALPLKTLDLAPLFKSNGSQAENEKK